MRRRQPNASLAEAWGCTTCAGCIGQIVVWGVVLLVLLGIGQEAPWLAAALCLGGLGLWVAWHTRRRG